MMMRQTNERESAGVARGGQRPRFRVELLSRRTVSGKQLATALSHARDRNCFLDTADEESTSCDVGSLQETTTTTTTTKPKKTTKPLPKAAGAQRRANTQARRKQVDRTDASPENSNNGSQRRRIPRSEQSSPSKPWTFTFDDESKEEEEWQQQARKKVRARTRQTNYSYKEVSDEESSSSSSSSPSSSDDEKWQPGTCSIVPRNINSPRSTERRVVGWKQQRKKRYNNMDENEGTDESETSSMNDYSMKNSKLSKRSKGTFPRNKHTESDDMQRESLKLRKAHSPRTIDTHFGFKMEKLKRKRGKPKKVNLDQKQKKLLQKKKTSIEESCDESQKEMKRKRGRSKKKVNREQKHNHDESSTDPEGNPVEREIVLKQCSTPRIRSETWRIWKSMIPSSGGFDIPAVDAMVLHDDLATTHTRTGKDFKSTYDFRIVYRTAQAKSMGGMHNSAIRCCHEALVDWYNDFSHMMRGIEFTHEVASEISEKVACIRESLAGLWCAYVHLLIEFSSANVGGISSASGDTFTSDDYRDSPQRSTRNTLESLPSSKDIISDAKLALETALCCPLVGDHHWVRLAYARLLIRIALSDHPVEPNMNQENRNNGDTSMASSSHLCEAVSAAIQVCNRGIHFRFNQKTDTSHQKVPQLSETHGRIIVSLLQRYECSRKCMEKITWNNRDASFTQVNWLPVNTRFEFAQNSVLVDANGRLKLCEEINFMSRLLDNLKDGTILVNRVSYYDDSFRCNTKNQVSTTRHCLFWHFQSLRCLREDLVTPRSAVGNQVAKNQEVEVSSNTESSVAIQAHPSSSRLNNEVLISENDDAEKAKVPPSNGINVPNKVSNIDPPPCLESDEMIRSQSSIQRSYTSGSALSFPAEWSCPFCCTNFIYQQDLIAHCGECHARKAFIQNVKPDATSMSHSNDCHNVKENDLSSQLAWHSIISREPQNLDVLDDLIDVFATPGDEVCLDEGCLECLETSGTSCDGPHFVGQLGLRCVYCTALDGTGEEEIFPKSLESLSHCAWRLCLDHLDFCPHIPEDVKERYELFRDHVFLGDSAVVQYWRELAEEMVSGPHNRGIQWNLEDENSNTESEEHDYYSIYTLDRGSTNNTTDDKPRELKSKVKKATVSIPRSLKTKVQRPPDAPYKMFAKEMRPRIIKKFPDISFAETVEILDKRWSRIEPQEKKRFQFMADHKPKRAVSDFFNYAMKMRKHAAMEFPDYSNTDISKVIGERWRDLSPQEKRPFEIMHEKEKIRFLKEMKEYKSMLQTFKT